MTKETTIRSIGNSKGIIIPSDILERMNATGNNVKVLLDIDDEGIVTMKVKKDYNESFIGPFSELAEYAAAWNEDPRSSVEIAEEIKSMASNKEIEEW